MNTNNLVPTVNKFPVQIALLGGLGLTNSIKPVCCCTVIISQNKLAIKE